MEKFQAILSFAKDTTLSQDAWSDFYLDKAIELAQPIIAQGEGNLLLHEAFHLSGEAKLRLLEVLLSFETLEFFEKYIMLLAEADFKTAQIIIDNLRCWNLTADQKAQLLKASQPFSGKSELLDMVIATIK